MSSLGRLIGRSLLSVFVIVKMAPVVPPSLRIDRTAATLQVSHIRLRPGAGVEQRIRCSEPGLHRSAGLYPALGTANRFQH